MKKYFLSIACVSLMACILTSCANKQQPFSLNGIVSDEIDDIAYFVYFADKGLNFSAIPYDTILVKDKSFSCIASIDEPCLIELQGIHSDGTVSDKLIGLILVPGEKAELKVCDGFQELSGSSFYNECGKFQKYYMETNDSLFSILKEFESTDKTNTDACMALLERHKNLSDGLLDYLKNNNNNEAVVVMALLSGMPTKVAFDDSNVDIRNGRFKTLFDTVCVREQQMTKKTLECGVE